VRKLLIILILGFSLVSCQQEKVTDWRFTLSQHSTEPYGCYLAKQRLVDMFPNEDVEGTWDIMKFMDKNEI